MKTKLNNEELFTQRIFQASKELGNVFFDLIKEPDRRNRFMWPFACIVANLTPESLGLFQLLNPNSFVEMLVAASIKKVGEVGPGSRDYSMLFPFAPLFHKNNIEMVGIGRDLTGYVETLFNDNHIQVIQERAGELKGEKLNLDLIIARNVFSYGGQGGNDELKIIADCHAGVINLLDHLSDNPNAVIILTEGYDVLALDRKVISEKADILCWHPLQTDNGFMYQQSGFNRIYKPYARTVFEQAANVVVLRKK